MPVRTRAIFIAFALLAGATAAAPPSARAAGEKVVIIVGPVGSLTDNYRNRGDQIAATAEAAGAQVVKVYSPDATWENVRAAVNGANVIVYVGHGNGYPNPYGSTELMDRTNGWGLNRIAGVDDADPTGDGDNWSTTMVYCGEKALLGTLTSADGAAQRQYCTGGPITPAPNFVMIYSNACYAPGAGEARPAPEESVAVSRVANYSWPILQLGGTYIATDLGSARMVDLVLRNPTTNFGTVFERGNGFDASALRRFLHPESSGSEVWVQKSYGLGDLDYWYAFAGNPSRTPSGGFVQYAGAAGVAFSDVAGSPFAADIQWLAESGITGGCGNGRFCPDAAVTRAQMASFLTRALGLSAGAGANLFWDDDGSLHEADIDRLATSGITGGCGDGRFCPDAYVTRAQMASFLTRALGLSAGAGANLFWDDDGSLHEADIDRLATSAITGGCGGGRYCPDAYVTRGQMAAFLHRAFGG